MAKRNKGYRFGHLNVCGMIKIRRRSKKKKREKEKEHKQQQRRRNKTTNLAVFKCSFLENSSILAFQALKNDFVFAWLSINHCIENRLKNVVAFFFVENNFDYCMFLAFSHFIIVCWWSGMIHAFFILLEAIITCRRVSHVAIFRWICTQTHIHTQTHMYFIYIYIAFTWEFLFISYR